MAGPLGFEPRVSGLEERNLRFPLPSLQPEKPSNETILKILHDFEDFLVVDLGLADRTVYGHVKQIERYLGSLGVNPRLARRGNIRGFLREDLFSVFTSTFS